MCMAQICQPSTKRSEPASIRSSPVQSTATFRRSNSRFSEIRALEPVDVAWISENYHDFKNMGQFFTDTNAMDRAVFAALNPGGTYVVTDYIAATGSGTRDTQSLHRIDP